MFMPFDVTLAESPSGPMRYLVGRVRRVGVPSLTHAHERDDIASALTREA
jgi:hypothetical protein